MNYISTRGGRDQVSAAGAIKQGLASDGGLFMPESIPVIDSQDIAKLCDSTYPERAAYILSRFLTDYTYEELLADCEKAYAPDRFVGGAAPIHKLSDDTFVLELWHGPTSAFKDMALQIMPKLLSAALKKTGEERTAFILVATSGDTGKAALEGYRDVDGVKIMVFYPVDGVSRVQKLQMATQLGENVSVCAIEGNFDDAQTGVKKIFADTEMAELLDNNGVFLSSANSINWGRLAPQIVYYVSAYCDLINSGEIIAGEMIDVTVPTGNFGNIFAAFIAKMMGLPINRLVCASNKNNILTDFLETGTYDRNRKFFTTMSPSMDILISSNLERLLYVMSGCENTAELMKKLNTEGCYTVDAALKTKLDEHFTGLYCDEAGTAATIRQTFEEDKYLIDTHTAVGLSCAKQYMAKNKSGLKMVVASTASPYKFASDVYTSIAGKAPADELSALAELSALTSTEIPYPLADIDKREIRFRTVIEKQNMPAEVKKTLGIDA
ncbi:MAG: threonine synthase [Ruminococcaceae bacterium]|nr:threonine synthase [Oscillospiraceae bacterium]